jgi:hypothetical protein
MFSGGGGSISAVLRYIIIARLSAIADIVWIKI